MPTLKDLCDAIDRQNGMPQVGQNHLKLVVDKNGVKRELFPDTRPETVEKLHNQLVREKRQKVMRVVPRAKQSHRRQIKPPWWLKD
jgi:hypothetical protein